MRQLAATLFLLAAATTAAADELPLASTIEGQLGGTDSRTFTLDLAAGDALQLEAIQDGVDLVLTIEGPGGPAQIDSPNGTSGPERLLYITPAAGQHKVSVKALEPKAPAGRFTLRAVFRHPATRQDKDRFESQKIIADAYKLRDDLKLREGIPLAERAIVLRERAYGKVSNEVADALTLRGYLRDETGDFRGGAADFARALAIHQKLYGPEDRATFTDRSNLAYLRFAEADFAEGRRLFNEGLALRAKAGMPLFDSRAGLAEIDRLLGNLEAAEAMYRYVIKAREDAGEGTRTSSARVSLGQVLVARGKLDEGEPLCARAGDELTGKPGFSRLSVLAARRCVAAARLARGDTAGALAGAQAVLDEQVKILGSVHPSLGETLTLMGRAHLATGELPAARVALERALAIRSKTWTRPHPALADTLTAIADLETKAGAPAKADAARRRAERILSALRPVLDAPPSSATDPG